MAKTIVTNKRFTREFMLGLSTHLYAPELNRLLFWSEHKIYEFSVPGIRLPDEAFAFWEREHDKNSMLTYQVFDDVSY